MSSLPAAPVPSPAGVVPFASNAIGESSTIASVTGKSAPWQYKWKRPRVAHIKPPSRIIGGNKQKHKDKRRGHQDGLKSTSRHNDLHARVLKHSQKEHLRIQKQLEDKIPISAASYRLNKDEARIILQGQEEKFGDAVDRTDGNNTQNDLPLSAKSSFKASHNADEGSSFRSNMKWEDLESESDEDENAKDKDKDNEKVNTDRKMKKRSRIPKPFATNPSSSARNQGTSNSHRTDDEDDECDYFIASVTTFASKRHIELMQMCTSSKSIIVPADTILIEIIQDSYSPGLDSANLSTATSKTEGVDNRKNPEEEEVANDEMGIVLSKLLYWPGSAFVNLDANELNVDHFDGRERGTGSDVRDIIDHDLHVAEEDGEDLGEDSNSAAPCFHGNPLKILKQMQSNSWNTIRSILHLPASLENMTIEEQQKYAKRQINQQLNLMKKKVGVTGICLSRSPPSPHTSTTAADNSGADTRKTVDLDAAMDVLDRLTLGIGLNLEPDVLTRSMIDNQDSLKSSDVHCTKDRHQHDGELVMSCLCSDDRVHIFPLLDLLYGQKKDPALTDDEVNFASATDGRKDHHDLLFGGFEQLMIGTYLTKSLQNDFLPLSNPKATIDLAVATMKRRLPVIMDVSVKDISDENGKKGNINASSLPHRSSVTNEVRSGLQDFQPQIELSLLDATIESSTIHDRTINNTPTICTSAFSYIIIAGKGTRKYRRRKEVVSNEEGEIHSAWEDIFLPGGFISLISTDYYTETRTIFLPFEPKLISPFRWKSTELILVMGETDDNSRAIRIDSSSYLTVSEERAGGTKNSFGRLHRPLNLKRHFVKKFTPFQISFGETNKASSSDSNTNTFPLSISSLPTDPPYIVLGSINEEALDIQLFSLDSLEINDHQIQTNALLKGSFGFPSDNVSLCAKHEARHQAKISFREHIDISTDDLVVGRSLPPIRNENIWCVSGQGWSILGLEILSRLIVFFISWEGASQKDGAFCEEIARLDIPHRNIARTISNSFSFHNRIIDAPNVSTGSSDRQIALSLLRIPDQNKTNLAISMRSNVILNGASSPFQDILSWLCENNDNFTAANIALHLLEDKDTLEDLHLSTKYYLASGDLKSWGALLDGVDPLDIGGFQRIHRCDSSTIKTPLSMGSMMTYEDRSRQQTCINLSNMTVTCLVNGGAAMAHTLDKFLGRNEFYEAPTACRMLVVAATDIIDNMSLNDMEYLAPYSYNPMECEGHVLWAIQGLLHVAVARDCMHTALRMLDKKIPDILRHRLRKESEKASCRSSLNLSKSIISMILASSEYAASEVMALVETGTRKLYWNSLERDTRMSLSLTHVQGRYPMLREREVRNWALERLHIATGLIDRSDITDMEVRVPSDWLRELCTASLSNAGCDLSQTILFTPILSLPDDIQDHNENAMLQKWQEDEEDLYDYLAADPGCGGIDFDLLIPALLLLESRNDHWAGNGPVSSQSILNIACDLAGRQSFEEPRFAFDSASVMKQCALMKNVLAAANLLGGRNGLVLKCSQVLVSQGGLNMKEAEQYLLAHALPKFSKENIPCAMSKHENINNEDKNDDGPDEFILSEGHKLLLWLLEKHVLNIKRYGDFHTKNRGQIDPIFASRICLRTWLFLMQSYAHSGPWLEAWLTDRLDLDMNEKDAKRLPYAAIIRALLWSEGPSAEATSVKELEASPVLAMSLGFSLTFVVNLTRVPCGLLESAPLLNMSSD